MKHVALLRGATEVTPENMPEALQQAIEIEIATIPVYLFTYYSIQRTPDQGSIQANLRDRLIEIGVAHDEADRKALTLSAQIMVFANKAGAVIMSVVVEEMLHMALSSNVKQALCGPPQLVGKGPTVWPAVLAGHEPPFPINRAKMGLAQLYTFLQIESPKPLSAPDGRLGALPYTTIGIFYEMIEAAIRIYYESSEKYNQGAPQLIPGRGYYAHNNINTNYYDMDHRPHFTNAADSGNLVHVVDMDSALSALATIVTQGEGRPGGRTLNPDGTVDCGPAKSPEDDDDDPAHREQAHFDKFNDLYCGYSALQAEFQRELQSPNFDVGSLFVYDTATNPSTSDYPAPLQDLSNLLNAVYTYVFVMTEACYRCAGNTQFEIFMFGIHKSMMWILGSLCETIVTKTYTGPDGKTYNAAPTFENWTFSAASRPKQQIIALYNQAAGSNLGLQNIGARIHDLPDVPIEPYQQPSRTPILA